jgi:D-arabinose 1-dehydrogenase-like Zn-dependent alcohol dehydrogenase
MDENRRCDICNVEISKTNWSKHIKTKKHLDAVQARREVNEGTDGVQIKRCGICNVDVNIVNERSDVPEIRWPTVPE